MDIQDHGDHTEELFGIRAEEIHKWIDGYFDTQGFQSFLQGQDSPGYDPYSHRKHRHCREALQEVQEEFQHKYSPKQIEEVFYTHLKDDYQGYIPNRKDFDKEDFLLKYHQNPHEEKDSKEPILSREELSQYFAYGSYKKKKSSRQWGFLVRIVLPSLLTAGLFIAFIFTIIVPSIERVLIDSKKEMIRELAQAAASVIYYYIDLEEQGLMTREAAQEETVSELVKMRYGIMGKDYYWITDRHPRMIMHPYRPELVGQDLRDYRDREDKSGKLLFVDAVKLTENQGEGFLRYQWQWMDDPDSSAEKMSFVMSIEPWGWILGTGVYIHDVELELKEIQDRLLSVSFILTAVIILMLAVMILQSRRIENSRRKAERGLVEAKERYRSLVERANEAYLLILDGNIVYSNQRMNQLLDLRENQVKEMELNEILSGLEPKEERLELVEKILTNQEIPGAVTARIGNSRGLSLMVTLSVSRVFFQDSDGYLLSFREIPPLQDSSQLPPAVYLEYKDIDSLIQEIRNSATHSHALLCLQSIPPLLYGNRQYLEDPEKTRREISRVYRALEEQVLGQVIQEQSTPPIGFAFLNLGSNARREITFYSDQDNALILDDRNKALGSTEKRYFQVLTSRVCKTLNQAGFPYCPGGIMAVNPRWSMGLSEWKQEIHQWIQKGEFKAMMSLNVLADMELVYGEEDLMLELREELFQAAHKKGDFLPRFASQCLSQSLPLNGLGQLTIPRVDGEKCLNLKNCLKALEGGARVLALEYKIQEVGTLERLEIACRRESALHPDSLEELKSAFNLLWKLRFRTQLKAHRNVQRVEDTLPLNDLTMEEKKELQKALNSIKLLQSNLSFRYFGQSIMNIN